MFHLVVILRMRCPLCMHEFICSVLYNFFFFKFQHNVTVELRKTIIFLEKQKTVCFLYNDLNYIVAIMHKDC